MYVNSQPEIPGPISPPETFNVVQFSVFVGHLMQNSLRILTNRIKGYEVMVKTGVVKMVWNFCESCVYRTLQRGDVQSEILPCTQTSQKEIHSPHYVLSMHHILL